MRLCVTVLLTASLFSGSQQALAACGFASTYTPASQPQTHPLKHAEISAAHPSLPAGTRVVVRNQQTGRSIVVRITGRSAFFSDGIIDLSTGALKALGMNASAPVCIEVVSYGSQKRGYEAPSLLGRLIEAFVPGHRHPHAANSAPVGSARAHHRRTHYARIHHGSGKRYAKLHRRTRRARHAAARFSRR